MPHPATIRMLAKIGPHLAAGDRREETVPAAGGIREHTMFLVPVACGGEETSTLVTRRPNAVQCPNCLATIPQENP